MAQLHQFQQTASPEDVAKAQAELLGGATTAAEIEQRLAEVQTGDPIVTAEAADLNAKAADAAATIPVPAPPTDPAGPGGGTPIPPPPTSAVPPPPTNAVPPPPTNPPGAGCHRGGSVGAAQRWWVGAGSACPHLDRPDRWAALAREWWPQHRPPWRGGSSGLGGHDGVARLHLGEPLLHLRGGGRPAQQFGLSLCDVLGAGELSVELVQLCHLVAMLDRIADELL